MIKIYNTADLKIFSDRVGHIYGTEDWSIFLYSVIKMHKPETVIELGCGSAASTMWMAQAVKENEVGHVWTVDNGQDWPTILKNNEQLFLEDERVDTFEKYIHHLTKKFELTDHLTYIESNMPPYPDPGKPIDMLFSDFQHGPQDLGRMLAFYLPRVSDTCSIFFDSASTLFPSYLFLEALIDKLNQGRVPRMVMQTVEPDRREKLQHFVSQSEFQLIHMTEAKNRAQNSTAWIKIQPCDLRPYPKTNFH